MPRKETYHIPLNHIGVISAIYADLEIAQRSEFMTLGMSMRTGIYQSQGLNFTRITLLNETPLKGYNRPGGRKMKTQTTSRPDHIWRHALTRIWESAKKKETRISNQETFSSMQKTVFPNMHSGNRCSKIIRPEVSEAKFICIDNAGEQPGTRIGSDEKI